MSDWPLELLGAHSDVRARIGWRGLSSDEYTENGPYLIAGKHLVNNKIDWQSCDHVSQWRYEESPEIALRVGDVVVSKDGTIGRVARVDALPGPATLNGTMMLVRPHPKDLDHRFLAHSLGGQAFQKLIADRISGSSIPHLFQRDLVKLELRLPPLEEQRRIAETLDTIDEFIRATEHIIAKLEWMRVGLREQLCASFGSTDQNTRLTDLVEAIVDCPHSTPEYRDSGIPVARTMHIKNGRFLESDASRVSEDTYSQRVARMVPSAGDVILTREAPVGEAFAVPDAMQICLGQRVVLIRPGQNLLGQYLVELIYSSQGCRQIRRLLAGTTNPHLNVDEIRHLAFEVPSLDEQSRALRSLDATSARIEAEASYLQELYRIRSGLAFDLLSGRVWTVAT